MNKYYSIVAPAKLNLNLFVINRGSNGFHYINSDVCFLELTDQISIKFNNKDIFNQNQKNKSLIINSSNNLILKTINKFRNTYNWDQHFSVYLEKKIPIGAGLGGGSADAAAILLLLRKLYNNINYKKISIKDIKKIAIQIGSDVPICLESKDLTLKGYGEKFSRASFANNYYFLLINPNIQLSTKKVFDFYANTSSKKTNNETNYFKNIKIYNSLLLSSINFAPQISSILELLKKLPNIVAYGMTGSGSTCFGIFKSKKEIISILDKYDDIKCSNYFFWYGQKKDYTMNRIICSKKLENKF